jgi:hypothetical protein
MFEKNSPLIIAVDEGVGLDGQGVAKTIPEFWVE